MKTFCGKIVKRDSAFLNSNSPGESNKRKRCYTLAKRVAPLQILTTSESLYKTPVVQQSMGMSLHTDSPVFYYQQSLMDNQAHEQWQQSVDRPDLDEIYWVVVLIPPQFVVSTQADTLPDNIMPR
jgi:hypothetical protein